jgi:hypothetical protein
MFFEITAKNSFMYNFYILLLLCLEMSIQNIPDNKIIPFYHTKFKENIETVFLKDKPQNETSLVGRLFSNKTETLKATAKSILDEILLRETLDLHLLDKINQDLSWQRIKLDHLNSLHINYIPESFKEMSKVITSLEKNIFELEQEKRKEYLECWRDLMELKKSLLLTLKDFWDLLKKREVLSGDVSELIDHEN